jgi:hypothetical protein
MTENKKLFVGGENVAMSVPRSRLEEVIGFYRDILGIEVRRHGPHSYKVEFGPITLWLDEVDDNQVLVGVICLELQATDTKRAREYLGHHGIETRNDIGPLPENYDGFWIVNPIGVIHLVSGPDA